ncbi:MAG TPA: UDP-N-acetylglucosamine 2-epimerase (non-hydrolyzing) [Candidatus Aveggerthella excrementigallinarum]|nr:UDP-N-acetylglucosamine 2-epimerase (non-hydrolyzing) [Candidatus Aveggerthella excrementigallinarum]
MCPLVKVLDRTPGIESMVCVTAQHRQMLDQVLEAFSVAPDFDLDIMSRSQTLTQISARVLEGFEGVLAQAQPDLVLVHGDTTTSMCAALAAFYQKIPVGHVEAGLRTYDRYSPFPEEVNRQITDRLSELLFCPTRANAENIAQEHVEGTVHITGNTVLDAFATTVREDYTFHDQALREVDFAAGPVILLTAHRRENWGTGIENICRAVKRVAEERPNVQVVFPVHLNPVVHDTVHSILGGVERVHLVEPLDVMDMHNAMARSSFIMTDSGGLQEEAPSLGKPVLVLRTETERPEVVACGAAVVAGVEEARIRDLALRLLDDEEFYQGMVCQENPFGDGHASERIARIILEWGGRG